MTSKSPFRIATTVAMLIALCSALNNFSNPNLITFDVYGYYTYLPAAITYQDLSEFKFVEQHFSEYDLGSGNYQVMNIRENRIPIYTMGLALLVSPFYLVADVISRKGGFPRDGLSRLYQFFFWLSSIFYCWIGFYFLSKWLMRYFSTSIIWILAIAISLGTNYFVYATLEAGLTHGYIFSLYCIILYLSEKWAEFGRRREAIYLALLIGLLCLIRPTEIICVLLPIGFYLKKVGLSKFLRLRFPHLVLMGVVGFAVILPQLVLWKLNTGQWIYNAYMDQNHVFHFGHPHIFEGLFSFRKGWLLYTPLMALAILGLRQLYLKSRNWFWPVLIYLVLHVYITFSWSMWWYASSFGSRPMVHAYAVLALPLGFLVSKFWEKWFFLLLILAGITLNIFQSWQYANKILPGDGINQVFYWKTFGKAEKVPSDIKYVDLEEALPNLEDYNLSEVATLNWKIFAPGDSTKEIKQIEGVACEEIDPKKEFSYPLVYLLEEDDFNLSADQNWIQVEANLYRKGDAFDAYNIAQLGVSFHQNGKKIHEDGIRFPFYLPGEKWDKANFEMRIPSQLKAGDMVKVFVWNPSPDTIYVQNLTLQRIEK